MTQALLFLSIQPPWMARVRNRIDQAESGYLRVCVCEYAVNACMYTESMYGRPLKTEHFFTVLFSA